MEELSRTCYGSISGRPLMAYDTEQEAEWAKDYQNHCQNRNMEAYQCGRCGKWHLAPQGHGMSKSKCLFCTGSDGSSKDIYVTAADAKRQADRVKKEKGIQLDVYRCPAGSGWHLTHRR